MLVILTVKWMRGRGFWQWNEWGGEDSDSEISKGERILTTRIIYKKWYSGTILVLGEAEPHTYYNVLKIIYFFFNMVHSQVRSLSSQGTHAGSGTYTWISWAACVHIAKKFTSVEAILKYKKEISGLIKRVVFWT